MPSYISSLVLCYLVLLLVPLTISTPNQNEVESQPKNDTGTLNTTISPFLTKLRGGQNRQMRARLQEHDCWFKPWICRKGLRPLEPIFCCRNRCVNVSSDPDNCGFCGIRCPFRWKCCRGICVDTMVNPFHCGDCDRKCRYPYPCQYGICGYAEPILSEPPKNPKPSFPFPPREERENAALTLKEVE